VIGFPANISSTPIEIFENEKPMLVEEKQLIPDTGGRGSTAAAAGSAAR